jgi:hypothetical protein
MMAMQVVATIPFVDGDSGDDAVVIVRAGTPGVALALSLRKNGDLMVLMQPEECRAVVAALERALGIAAPQGG